MDNTTHVCLGKCHAAISNKQYKNGLIACGNHLCEKKGKPFVVGYKCKKCDKTYEEGIVHQCSPER